jgi:uncharacterized protein YbaR (Trm112 family)/SAM-dependent methyltransferase
MKLHPLHALARCPYDVDGDGLVVDGGSEAQLVCPACHRRYAVDDGIYRLMRDELRTEGIGLSDADPASLQMKREMSQRDARAGQATASDRASLSSPLYWMNVQYDAVVRHVRFPSHGVGVDFGAGVGRYVPWMLESLPHVVVIDFSFESLRSLRRALTSEQRERCLLIQCDLSRIGMARGIASAGLCIEVLQHLPNWKFRRAAVEEMARVVSPGGELFLVTKAYTPVLRVVSTMRSIIGLDWRRNSASSRLVGVGRERRDGSIYTYLHTYRELDMLTRNRFFLRRRMGIISCDTFPISRLPRHTRMAVDAWFEGNRLGRLFGRDMLLELERRCD